MPNILFQTGGPYHPVGQQADLIRTWLPAGWTLETAHGADVFDRLDAADVFVAAGLHWTGLGADGKSHVWTDGVAPHGYVALTEKQKAAFRAYVSSGRAILGFHGGVASYDDWPEYGNLLGFRWQWGITGHTPVKDWTVLIEGAHPSVAGVETFTLNDEIYYGIQVAPQMDTGIHAAARPYEGIRVPMVLTANGGRSVGAGRTAYLANGHSMKSFECPALRPLWLNTLHWLVGAA